MRKRPQKGAPVGLLQHVHVYESDIYNGIDVSKKQSFPIKPKFLYLFDDIFLHDILDIKRTDDSSRGSVNLSGQSRPSHS